MLKLFFAFLHYFPLSTPSLPLEIPGAMPGGEGEGRGGEGGKHEELGSPGVAQIEFGFNSESVGPVKKTCPSPEPFGCKCNS